MVTNKTDMLQEPFLNDLRKQRKSVTVYLINGVRQVGTIESFDRHAILLRHRENAQLIYKHTIATVMQTPNGISATMPLPAKRVNHRSDGTAPVVVRKLARRPFNREE